MQPIKSLFPHSSPRQVPQRRRRTERGDLLDTFLARLNPQRVKDGYKPLTYGRLSYLLAAIPTRDLYALVSKMNDAERRGVPAGAVFWTEIKPNQPSV